MAKNDKGAKYPVPERPNYGMGLPTHTGFAKFAEERGLTREHPPAEIEKAAFDYHAQWMPPTTQDSWQRSMARGHREGWFNPFRTSAYAFLKNDRSVYDREAAENTNPPADGMHPGR